MRACLALALIPMAIALSACGTSDKPSGQGAARPKPPGQLTSASACSDWVHASPAAKRTYANRVPVPAGSNLPVVEMFDRMCRGDGGRVFDQRAVDLGQLEAQFDALGSSTPCSAGSASDPAGPRPACDHAGRQASD